MARLGGLQDRRSESTQGILEPELVAGTLAQEMDGTRQRANGWADDDDANADGDRLVADAGDARAREIAGELSEREVLNRFFDFEGGEDAVLVDLGLRNYAGFQQSTSRWSPRAGSATWRLRWTF